MNSKPPSRATRVLVVLSVAASVIGAGAGRGRAFTGPGENASPQPEAKAPRTPSQDAVRLGVWRKFGESNNAPQARPGGSNGWRRFASRSAVANAGSNQSTVRQNLSTRRPGGYVPRPSYAASSVAELESEMLALVNRDRSDPGNTAETAGEALPLRWNEGLAAVARAHSQDMIEQGYFDHVDRKGRSPYMRVNAAGIRWQSTGENIAMYPGVTRAEAAFMNEPRFQPNHRANILNRNYTEVGIGIVQGLRGTYYITQEFIEPPRDLQASVNASSSGRGTRQTTALGN